MHSAKTERDLLIERLLLEHKERQQRQQRQPERPPVRTAWEDDLDRNERQLEQELGLPHLQPHKASCEDAEAASVSDVSPPRYPEAYLDGELAPGEETLEGERPLMGSDELLGFDDGLGADVDGSLAPDPRLAPSSPLQASSCAVAAEASTPGPREPRAVGPPEGSSRTPASGAAQGRRPEAEQPAAPTFQPQINPRSAALASTRPGDCYSRLASLLVEQAVHPA
jgi:hypothetical protein